MRVENGVSARQMEASRLAKKHSRHYSCEVKQNLFRAVGGATAVGTGQCSPGAEFRDSVDDRYEQALKIFDAVVRMPYQGVATSVGD